jgi:hypothetical protein
MVDAPEKIWIEQNDCPYFYEESELTEVGSPVTEYVRADLCSALEAQLVASTGAVKHELSGNTRELIDRMAEAIRGDTTSDDTPWATLSEDRKIGWRGDADRALAVVKDYLTARRPAEQAVTEAEHE